MSAMRAGLSILIPVFNRDVAALVGSLQAQAGDWPGAVEIILLDDKSAENCQRMNRPLAALPGVRYEELPANVGRAAIRNQLAAKAEHDWLLLLDNDSLLPDDAVSGPLRASRFYIAGRRALHRRHRLRSLPPADPSLRLRWLLWPRPRDAPRRRAAARPRRPA
ncbi:MAG: glycosyltransferase [Hymenobacter sp.]